MSSQRTRVVFRRLLGEELDDAALIALIAWVATFIVLYMLALMNIAAFDAVGVPGV